MHSRTVMLLALLATAAPWVARAETVPIACRPLAAASELSSYIITLKDSNDVHAVEAVVNCAGGKSNDVLTIGQTSFMVVQLTSEAAEEIKKGGHVQYIEKDGEVRIQ
ncbi:hypothetical protein BJ085DRAFT_38849 [Dimargaris cristalligena]|uniref:Uncharacterized protein n=1 Tax=Dimargaris cristalligena TaxID=215637 RepID=A0A4P9ZUB2_9FUNG|nr:hypothetical protein BJ085DRAFT_38849 [Dimargaris cristalligena]|eukprot:RKP36828.1 hypothetical protein BJ085DRAFT_38849 [Dimargaris cristalligena]